MILCSWNVHDVEFPVQQLRIQDKVWLARLDCNLCLPIVINSCCVQICACGCQVRLAVGIYYISHFSLEALPREAVLFIFGIIMPPTQCE